MNKLLGVVVGTVVDVHDPLMQGRIRVNYPWLDDNLHTDWVRIATMMAGNQRGSFFMPEVGDEVLVAFEHGDARFGYVIGFLWNGQDAPPAQDVRDRKIVSKNGHQIRFLDSTPNAGDMGALIIEDAHGNRITMSNGKVQIQSVGVLEIEAPTILIGAAGVKRLILPNGNPI